MHSMHGIRIQKHQTPEAERFIISLPRNQRGRTAWIVNIFFPLPQLDLKDLKDSERFWKCNSMQFPFQNWKTCCEYTVWTNACWDQVSNVAAPGNVKELLSHLALHHSAAWLIHAFWIGHACPYAICNFASDHCVCFLSTSWLAQFNLWTQSWSSAQSAFGMRNML